MKPKATWSLAVALFAPVLVSCGGDGSSEPEPATQTGTTGTTGGASSCTSVAGTWAVTDTATVSCSGSFGSGSDTDTARGNVTITQTGCSISFTSPANTQRSGTVSGNSVQVSGPLALTTSGVSYTQNQIVFSGTIASGARRIDFSGAGTVSGTAAGSPGSCTANSTEVFTR